MQYHVCTFHKCASNWTRRLFREAAALNKFNVWVNKPNDSPVNQPIERGASGTICIYRNGSRRDFLEKAADGERVVLCVRDPKDVVVSQYWSWKGTHRKNNATLLEAREILNTLSTKEGLMHLIENRLVRFPEEVKRWTDHTQDSQVYIMRYENLLTSFCETYADALEFLGLPHPPENELELVREKYSFNSLAGRDPGKENVQSHYRKGVAGDWKSYFDKDISAVFDREYGRLCDALGYARALD